MTVPYNITFSPSPGSTTLITYRREDQLFWITPAGSPTDGSSFTLYLDEDYIYYVKLTSVYDTGTCADASVIIVVDTASGTTTTTSTTTTAAPVYYWYNAVEFDCPDCSTSLGAIVIASTDPDLELNKYYKFEDEDSPRRFYVTSPTIDPGVPAPIVIPVAYTPCTLACTDYITTTTTTTTTSSTTTTTTTTSSTTTSSTTTTTTTTTTIAPLSMCADCNLVLEGTIPNELSQLTAGVISSTGCVVGDYVIEWYLDGSPTPSFVSGSAAGIDPDVTVVHPFSGEPAEGGTWHPSIRWIFLDGLAYSTDGTVGTQSSDLGSCLPDITVLSLTCINGSLVTSPYGGDYQHHIGYENTVDSSTLASRSFRFDLDGTDYFAWQFLGYNVPDTMKITYVSPSNATSTQIESWEVGTDGIVSDVTIPNSRYAFIYMRKVTDMSAITFAAGDYLRIDVTPGALSNTNWDFYCKCMTTVDCDIFDSTNRQISSTPTFAHNPTTCAWELSYTKPTWSGGDVLFTEHLLGSQQYYGGGYVIAPTFDSANVKLALSQKTDGLLFATDGYADCAAQVGSSTITRSGTTITVVFANVADYNYHKNSYTNATTNPNILSFINDPTIVEYYKFWYIYLRAANSCGDTQEQHNYLLHHNNPPSFNDGTKTMTINLATLVNGYVPLDGCDKVGDFIDSMFLGYNAQMTHPDYGPLTSFIRADVAPVVGFYVLKNVIDETDKRFRFAYQFASVDICDLVSLGWNTQSQPYNEFEFSTIDDRVIITNNADPANNFELWRWMPVSTGTEISDYMLVYRKLAGVVTDNRVAYNAT
jgi:hypothetical protein